MITFTDKNVSHSFEVSLMNESIDPVHKPELKDSFTKK